ncbi:fibronectin type III domain-containing protein [Streptomyces sp. BI20]|uniref:fibronectin type III domain-containing protein n=1 Tax=Streptomyces sp. BI20 TaxID=3403460 RepID=UPI003C729781
MRRPRPGRPLACALLLALGATGCADTTAPAAPTGLTAQAGSSGSAHVMWEAPADPDGDLAGWQVLRDGKVVAELPAEKHMTDVTGLAPGTAHRFTARARDRAGNLSAPAPEVTATTPAARPEDHTPPPRPTALTARVDGPRAVTLTWTPGSGPDAADTTAFDVYQGGVRVHTAPAGSTRTTVPALRPDTVYTFTVRARDGADNSSPDSPAADAATPPAAGEGPSTAPADLAARAAGGEITLSWTPPASEKPITSYEVYLDGKAVTTLDFGEGAVPTGRAEYRLTDTAPAGTVRALKLRARLPDGTWGAFSAERRVTL